MESLLFKRPPQGRAVLSSSITILQRRIRVNLPTLKSQGLHGQVSHYSSASYTTLLPKCARYSNIGGGAGSVGKVGVGHFAGTTAS